MATTKLPPVDTIPSLAPASRADILDLLFEPSTPLHTLSVPLLQQLPFATYQDLIAAVGVQLTNLGASVSTSDTAWLESILSAHPRLGAKKVDSAQSAAEQAQLQGSRDEAEMLQTLNEEYEARFPGLRYVVFVNGRGREVIMNDMRRRIEESNLEAEIAAAIRVSRSFSLPACKQVVSSISWGVSSSPSVRPKPDGISTSLRIPQCFADIRILKNSTN